MSTMIYEVYDALIEAGASEEKAKAAARALADYNDRFNKIDNDTANLDNKIDTKFAALDNKIDLEVANLDNKIDTKFAALDNKIDLEVANLDNKIDTKFAALDNKIDTKFAALDNKIDLEVARLDNKIDMLRTEVKGDIKALDARLAVTQWMIGFVIAGMTAMLIKSFWP